MYYFLYKTTNLKNGKYYYGVHSTNNIEDRYLGSGLYLKRAIRKEGRKYFCREIISFFDNEEEMYKAEKNILKEIVLNDPLCYNLQEGGNGGWSHLSKEYMSNIKKNWWSKPENREKISSKIKDFMKNNPDIKDKVVEKMNKKRISLIKSGISYSEAISKGLNLYWLEGNIEEKKKKRSEETKGKMRLENRNKLSKENAGFNNKDFIKRWKPFYENLIQRGIVIDIVNKKVYDIDIQKKYGEGFKILRVINYLVHLKIIEIVSVEKTWCSTARTHKRKTICQYKENI